MILIIDAYNVLKNMIKSSFVEQVKIKKFINLLSNYAKKKRHKILLVFDGELDNELLCTQFPFIDIVCSGTNSADDYIKSYVNNTDKRKNDMLLVSSDRNLCTFVLKYKIPTMDSDAFILLINDQKSKKIPLNNKNTKIYKTSGKQDSALDKLMQEGSNSLMFKDELENFQKRKSSSCKLSKKEKEIIRISKKL